jgi:hypothetical protein
MNDSDEVLVKAEKRAEWAVVTFRKTAEDLRQTRPTGDCPPGQVRGSRADRRRAPREPSRPAYHGRVFTPRGVGRVNFCGSAFAMSEREPQPPTGALCFLLRGLRARREKRDHDERDHPDRDGDRRDNRQSTKDA